MIGSSPVDTVSHVLRSVCVCVRAWMCFAAFWASYSFRVAGIIQQYNTGNRQYRHRLVFVTFAFGIGLGILNSALVLSTPCIEPARSTPTRFFIALFNYHSHGPGQTLPL